MTKRWTMGLTIALCVATARAGEPPAASLADLAWIAGCWDGSGGGREIAEQWMKPSGGTMLGMSRTVASGKTVAHEFLMIREDEHGAIHYVSRPSGQAEASFVLVRVAEHEAVFENPDHDFPQRILYQLTEDGTLAAAIEGTVAGQAKRVDFPMRRVTCE